MIISEIMAYCDERRGSRYIHNYFCFKGKIFIVKLKRLIYLTAQMTNLSSEVLTESAAAQRDRLQLDRRGFLEACGGQAVQHRLGEQQRAEVYTL